MKDAELVLRARGGDELAFRRLTERHRDLIGILLAKYFGGGGLERDDFEQEAIFGLHKAVRDYRPGHASTFRTFASLVIERQVITALKSARRAKHSPLNDARSFSTPVAGDEDDLELGSMVEDQRPGPARQFEISEELSELAEIVRVHLSALERRTVAYFADGLSYEEISERTGDSPKTIDNALQRARRKLSDPGCRPGGAEMVPFLQFRHWLRRRRRELGCWKRVARSVDRSYTYVTELGNRSWQETIRRSTVEQMLAGDGSAAFEDLYPDHMAAA